MAFTNEQIIKALQAADGLVFCAARRLRCSHVTIYKRMQSSPEVRRCLEATRGRLLDAAEQALARAVKKGESWAVQFLLKTLGKDRGYVEDQGGGASSTTINIALVEVQRVGHGDTEANRDRATSGTAELPQK